MISKRSTQLDRFLFLRNGVFTFKKRIEGRRSPMQVSLETTDRRVAREKRDEILRKLDDGELEAIRGPRVNRAKIGQVLDAFNGVRSLKTIGDRYVRQCAGSVYLFLRWALGEQWTDDQLAEQDISVLLSPDTFAQFRQHYFADAQEDRKRLKSRERGAAGLLRHVHAVFAEDARPLYRHLALDWRKVEAWMKESRIACEQRRHATLDATALCEMADAVESFYESWPDFWLAHALHKFAGMRNEEICEARVEWFERAPWGQVFLVCRTRPYYEFKGSDGSIPIHSSLVPRLLKFVDGKQPTDHLLGTARPTDWKTLTGYINPAWNTQSLDARHELVDRIHAQWMRRWTPPEKFAKRGYELRRWAAQVMELKYGKDAASAFLRHARASVAERHYLEEWNQWRRLGSDLGVSLDDVRGATENVSILGSWTTGAAALGVSSQPSALSGVAA